MDFRKSLAKCWLKKKTLIEKKVEPTFVKDHQWFCMAANEHVELRSGKHIKSYGSHGPFIEGLPFLKMVIFYSYVKLPEGNQQRCGWKRHIFADWKTTGLLTSSSKYNLTISHLLLGPQPPVNQFKVMLILVVYCEIPSWLTCYIVST